MDAREIANVEQARAWDGEEGDHWAAHVERYDRAVRDHSARLRSGSNIAAHERVLDVGCGNGASTLDAARAASSGSAMGIDLSAAMLARARAAASADGLTNIEFVQGDAQAHPFEAGSFDVAISRFGVMFFSDPTVAFSNIFRALTPGGRLALIAWKTLGENEWFSEIGRALAVGRERPEPPVGAPSPFGLAYPDHVMRVLGAAGFRDVALDGFDAPFYAGADADDAFVFISGLGFTRMMLEELDDATKARALGALRATLADHETDPEVTFDSACWFITATRP